MKTKFKVTVAARLDNDYINVRTFYCKTLYSARKLINEYAVKDDTVNIEMEVL